jgi:hypothetical protein
VGVQQEVDLHIHLIQQEVQRKSNRKKFVCFAKGGLTFQFTSGGYANYVNNDNKAL